MAAWLQSDTPKTITCHYSTITPCYPAIKACYHLIGDKSPYKKDTQRTLPTSATPAADISSGRC